VRALRDRGADLLTVAGRQEMHTFWEKVVQPYVFAVLLLRYGGMEAMSRSTDPRRKIANGQYLLFTREAYERAGGHHAVRDHVAEDLLLAQRLTALGMRVHMLLAREHLATRMYASLAEIRAGWGKNVFAAGRDTLPANRLVRALFPFALPKVVLLPAWPAYAALVGWLVLQAIPLLPVPAGAALRGIAIAVFWAGALAAPVNLVAWMAVYVFSRLHPLWALLHPLGGLVFSWICVEAAVRGDRVSWKGRTYGSPAHAAARAVRPPGSA
jgi:chlorobactene glucosyltransferase